MVRQLVRDWWRQPDQFDAVTALLRQRELLQSTQLLLGVVAGMAGIVPTIMVTTSARSTSAEAVASVLAGAYVAVAVCSFARRWPSRRQSATMATGGAVVIGAWSMAQTDPTLQFLACAVLVIPGAYLAVFHTTKLMSASSALSAGTAIAAAMRTGRRTDMATAAASFCVLWLLNLAIPLGARGLSRAMTRYATDAYHDPLTGLLNRRGFDQRIRVALSLDQAHTHLAVLLADLDDFKLFNDTHGHPRGDRLLQEVARLLHQHCPAYAAICRSGGEEFLIAYATTDPGPPPLASQLCAMIASIPDTVTVSIGTTTVALPDLKPTAAFDAVVDAADAAMYRAKRDGGNRTHHHNSDHTPTGKTHPLTAASDP